MTDHRSVLASEAYVFGFPLVFNLQQVIRLSESGIGDLPPTGFNAFSHARALSSPRDTFVSVNNDTLYSMAVIDLSAGPIVFSVPDPGDRYHVFQFVDAWTDNFAYVGTRGTGGGSGEFLLVPHDWDGSSGHGSMTVIRFPTTVGVIVGRWACDGVQDLSRVHALQDALSLRPVLETFTAPAGVPDISPVGDEALDFFERLRVWSQAFPPAPTDAFALDSYEGLGLTGSVPIGQIAPEIQDALRAGYSDGKQALESAVQSGEGPVAENWTLNIHLFDYNIDFFEVGTIDEPEWRHDDAATRYAVRAAAARGGLWGNHGYEAVYATTFVDAAGERLTGEHTYRLRLHPTPPVDAFWSLTMYDLPQFFLVENPIDRYSIGDRTQGIVYDDGGLTITMSATRPADPKEAANWLPAPAGPFRPMLRMYAPRRPLREGDYVLPAIERID